MDRIRSVEAILDSLGDAVVGVDRDGRVVLVNGQFERLFGYTRGEIGGRPVEVLIPGRLAAGHRRRRESFAADPHARPMGSGLDLHGRRQDGTEFPVEISLSPTSGIDGVHVLAVVRDLSARLEADDQARAVVNRIAEAVSLVAADGVHLHANGAARRILDTLARRDRGDTMTVGDLVALRDDGTPLPVHELPAEITRRTGREVSGAVVAFRGVAGDTRWLRVSTRRLADGEPPHSVVVSFTDVTEQRLHERRLAEAEERLRTLFENAPNGIVLAGLDGRFSAVNPAFERLVGRSADELAGTRVAAIVHPEDLEAFDADVRALLPGTATPLRADVRLLDAHGDPVWVQLDVAVLRDADGRPEHLLAQLQDISERRRHAEVLAEIADHDDLTGLLNRRGLDRELERQAAHARRCGGDGAVLVLDLDHFKYVNDTHGHKAGDQLIRDVADLLRTDVRADDVVARLGGDEFAVLLPQGTEAAAAAMARSLLARLRSRSVTASIGVAAFDGESRAEDVLVRADLAMYDAKEGGRDGVACYDDSPAGQPAIKARMTWLNRLRAALDDGGLRLLAQPIERPGGGGPVMHELLLRLVGDDGELVPPAVFLPIAERFDLVQRIDRWVVGEACRMLAGARRAGRPVAFTVNLSGKSLAGSGLLAHLEGALAAAGADPRDLVLEITETSAVEHMEDAQAFATAVRALGCRVAIDDFGAGFGSFHYLKHLPFDYLKIDGEFVTHAPDSRPDELIVGAVRDLAHGMDRQVVAEFVSDARLRDWLADRGVDLVQGYHVGRPVPVEEVLEGAIAGAAA